jgi:hypothetical protein
MHFLYEMFGFRWYNFYWQPARWSPPLFDHRGRVIPRPASNPRAR